MIGKNYLTNQHGFTVIEMLIAVAVSGLLLIMTMTFMVNTLVNNSVANARADLLHEAQLTMDTISKNIRLSASVDQTNRWQDVNSPFAVATDGYGWDSDDTTVILATSATDTDDNLLFEDTTHYITYKDNVIYFIEGQTLKRRIIAGDIANNNRTTSCPKAVADSSCPEDKILANNVSGFTVRYLDSQNFEVDPSQARSVELEIKLSEEKYGRKVTADYTTRTVFRNE